MIREHHLPVTRTARYHTLGLAAGGAPRQLWIVCHGYGQLAARFLRHFETIDDGTRLIVAPEGLSRFYLGNDEGSHVDAKVGATWMTREDRLSQIADYVRYLDTLYRHVFAAIERQSARVVVLGFSQGAATAARWTALGRVRPDALVLWGAPAPPDLDLADAARAWSGTRVTLVYGRADPLHGEARALVEAERLRAAGIAPELLGFDGGHVLVADVLERLAVAT
jgi:predicted esterase